MTQVVKMRNFDTFKQALSPAATLLCVSQRSEFSINTMLTTGIPQPCFLAELASKTVIVTGGAGGIGAATARVFNQHGANVVVADIPASKERAEQLVATFPYPRNALFIPVDILNWKQMNHLFRETIKKFGAIDTVVANAAIMEKTETLDVETTDSDGNLLESTGAFEVIDVNLKGTLNSECIKTIIPTFDYY
jgi:NADP-dependent 3-hydroxy acid dehydrogenase YdfG